jgi:ketosteroid isomerase-like protein
VDGKTGETLRSPTVTPKLQQSAEQAAHDPERVFWTLAHLSEEDFLREAYRHTSQSSAAGVDGGTAQPETRAADEQAIRETDMAWSQVGAAKDLERTLAFYADDASVFPPHAPMATGKAAMRAVWSPLFTTPGFAMRWQPTKVEVSRGGDLGYSMGTYEFTTHDPMGKHVTARGRMFASGPRRRERLHRRTGAFQRMSWMALDCLASRSGRWRLTCAGEREAHAPATSARRAWV